MVGLDGGYVRNWEDRKTNFEVIVGQSVPEDRDARYVGLVHGYDRKPKRRLFDVLKSQGLQANQDVTFLTDGGEEIRALTELVTPAVRACARLVSHHHAPDGARASMPAASPHDDAAEAPACWHHWNGSNGCSGTATNTVPARTIDFFEDDVDATGGGLPEPAQIRPRRARVRRLHRLATPAA